MKLQNPCEQCGRGINGNTGNPGGVRLLGMCRRATHAAPGSGFRTDTALPPHPVTTSGHPPPQQLARAPPPRSRDSASSTAASPRSAKKARHRPASSAASSAAAAIANTIAPPPSAAPRAARPHPACTRRSSAKRRSARPRTRRARATRGDRVKDAAARHGTSSRAERELVPLQRRRRAHGHDQRPAADVAARRTLPRCALTCTRPSVARRCRTGT